VTPEQAMAHEEVRTRLEASIKKEQHRWSVQQGVLVALTQERQANGEKTRKLLTQHTILQQRKLRTQSMHYEEHARTHTFTRMCIAHTCTLTQIHERIHTQTHICTDKHLHSGYLADAFIQSDICHKKCINILLSVQKGCS
jgi:hypothetical protein